MSSEENKIIISNTGGVIRRMDHQLELMNRVLGEIAERKTDITPNASSLIGSSAGEERDWEIAPGVKMTFCWCPPGEFLMGSPETEEGRKPDEAQILVRLRKGFWMAKTQVTQRQWVSIMGENPSKFIGDDFPVETVNWNDAQEFVAKLNMQTTDFGRVHAVLPTEAQWEYACRAGTICPFSGEAIDELAWYWDNSEKQLHHVGTKSQNAWGLHDMHGNLDEWCSDWYKENLIGGVDPVGPEFGTEKVFRGGSWLNSVGVCRSASRQKIDPAIRHFLIGFRVACISAC